MDTSPLLEHGFVYHLLPTSTPTPTPALPAFFSLDFSATPAHLPGIPLAHDRSSLSDLPHIFFLDLEVPFSNWMLPLLEDTIQVLSSQAWIMSFLAAPINLSCVPAAVIFGHTSVSSTIL